MYDHEKLTLMSYANQHKRETGHIVQIFYNFTHCPFCRDHAHYWKPGWLIQHNSDYSINNQINVDLELYGDDKMINEGYDLSRVAAELQNDLELLISKVLHTDQSPGGFLSGPFESRWSETVKLAIKLDDKLKGL